MHHDTEQRPTRWSASEPIAVFDSRSPAKRIALVSGLVAVASMVSIGVLHASPSAGADDAGAQVIAQGLVDFDDRVYGWSAGPIVVADETVSFGDDTPSFLLAGTGSPMAIAVADVAAVNLDDGEAIFQASGADLTAVSVASTAGSLTSIDLAEAPTGADTFEPGDGRREVELHRMQLKPGERFVVDTELVGFALVTEGVVDVGGVSAAAGNTAAVGDATVLTVSADEPATTVVATIGPLISNGSDGSPAEGDDSDGNGSDVAPEPSARATSEPTGGSSETTEETSTSSTIAPTYVMVSTTAGVPATWPVTTAPTTYVMVSTTAGVVATLPAMTTEWTGAVIVTSGDPGEP